MKCPTLSDPSLIRVYYLLICLQTCDKRLYITNIVARYPGATNDSFIFANSALRRKMIELHGEEQCFLLGTEAITS